MTRITTSSKTVIFCAFFLVLFVTGCSLASEPIPLGPVQRGPLPEELPPFPTQTPSLINGSLIFAEHCADCHGTTGDGVGELAAELEAQNAEVPVLADPALASQRSPADWFTQITNGTVRTGGLMPPWSNSLTPSERWDVTYYLYSLSVTPDQLSRAEDQYQDLRTRCTDEAIALATPPDLAETSSQSPQMLIDSYLDDSEDCIDTTALPEEDRYALAIYLLTLSSSSSPHASVAEESQSDTASEDLPQEDTVETTSSAPEIASDRGRVEGSVMLDEGDTTSPVNIEVTLEGLALDETDNFQQIHSATVTTDDSGRFEFDDLPWDVPQSAYIVTVQYDGMEFGNGAILDGISSTVELPITVYRTTSDPAVVRLDSVHINTQTREDGLLVSEILVFSNTSDKVFITGENLTTQSRASVALTLPAEATQIQFQENAPGQQFIARNGRYYDTRPLYPGDGQHTILVQYLLPSVDGYEFDLPLFYQSNSVTVIVDQDQTIQSSMLDESRQSEFNGEIMTIYQGGNFPPDAALAFHLRPKSPVTPLLPFVFVGIIVAAGGGSMLLFRRRFTAPYTRTESTYSRNIEELVQQVIQLDADFEAGRINRIDFEAERAQLCYEIAVARES